VAAIVSAHRANNNSRLCAQRSSYFTLAWSGCDEWEHGLQWILVIFPLAIHHQLDGNRKCCSIPFDRLRRCGNQILRESRSVIVAESKSSDIIFEWLEHLQ
jgi:hypothetical protein